MVENYRTNFESFPFDENDFQTIASKRVREKNGRFKTGDLIMNRYKVLNELGQGGMGIVYRCLDETAGIEVALKSLPPELSHNELEMEDIRANFQLVHNLHHPNIANSNNLERNIHTGDYYLIMECCNGEDLRRWIRRKRELKSLTVEEIIPIIRQIASALDYAHTQQIVHRDIKPGNIMINFSEQVKVLDFGLAAQIHSSMSRVSVVAPGVSGTGPYMAPEQWRGRLQGASADQYALAVITYEMLAGHLPFENSDPAILREAVLNDIPENIPGVPSKAQAAILRAMSKNPAERFETCSDFVDALAGKNFKSGSRNSDSHLLKYSAIAAVIVLLGAGAFFFYSGFAQKKDNDKSKGIGVNEENYLLQPDIKNKKALIELANHDRGETFGTHLDALERAFSAAELAWSKNDAVAANKFYKAAKQECEWITLNAPLRKEAARLRNDVEKLRSNADEFDGKKLASTLYLMAEEKVLQAEKEYDSGSFTDAISSFKSAISNYEKAYNDSRKMTLDNFLKLVDFAIKNNQYDYALNTVGKIRQIDIKKADELEIMINKHKLQDKIDKLLADALKAKQAEKWDDVYTLVLNLLKADPANKEGMHLLKEAEKFRKPSLKIIARINGSPVSAEFCWRRTDAVGKTENAISDLPKSKVMLNIFTEKNGSLYYAELPVECNWNGIHTISVDLKKLDTTSTTFKENFLKALKHNAEAQNEVALAYRNGDGVAKDPIQAVYWFKKSALQGYAKAQNVLAICYENGEGTNKNMAQAIYWYKKSAEQGYANAQYNLAICYEKGEGTNKNMTQAIYWYKKAAEQGFAKAQFEVGLCYDRGKGVEQDYKKAFDWFLKAANQNHDVGMFNIGVYYANGYGVEKDVTKAVMWYRKAAEQNYADAQNNLGFCYENGHGMEKDLYQAVYWYKKAAEQGFAMAQSNLAYCYEKGNGVEKDMFEAVKWYKKAAEQNDARAENALGIAYYNGSGVEKNLDTAFFWFKRAAEHGEMYGQNNLGECYRDGEGTTKDLDLASYWFRKSMAQGYDKARKNLENMIGQ